MLHLWSYKDPGNHDLTNELTNVTPQSNIHKFPNFMSPSLITELIHCPSENPYAAHPVNDVLSKVL